MATVQRSKGTIRFSFKDSLSSLIKQSKKESLIMLHFSYGKMRFKYSTGHYSCFADWDENKQRIRNKAHITDRDFVNDYLNRIEAELYKEISSLNAVGSPIAKAHLKQKLDEITGKTEPAIIEDVTFYRYFDQFCKRKQGKIEDVTLRSYNQTKRLLKEFNSKLDFDDIDLNLYDSFVQFLEEDDKSLNTIGKHIKNLKVVLGSATKDGINKNLIYTRSDFKASKEQTTAIYLDELELDKIAAYDLLAYPNLDRARDIFLIGCYTGQRVSDYNGLTESNIVVNEGVRFFKIIQKKTKNEVYCPITKEIQAILNKPRYENVPPPKMNEQDINEYIKEVGRKVGIVDMVKKTYTKGGKEIIETIPKYKLITTHTARRSFCTNMYKKKMPIYEIMEFSGHSTEKEFYKYIRIEKKEKALKIANSGYFNI